MNKETSVCFDLPELHQGSISKIVNCLKFRKETARLCMLWPISLKICIIPHVFLIVIGSRWWKQAAKFTFTTKHTKCVTMDDNFDNTGLNSPHCIEIILDVCLISTSDTFSHNYHQEYTNYWNIRTHLQKRIEQKDENTCLQWLHLHYFVANTHKIVGVAHVYILKIKYPSDRYQVKSAPGHFGTYLHSQIGTLRFISSASVLKII
jgi:hypothetical protein